MKENKKALVESAMLEIKGRIGQRSCNIYAYDIKKAYERDKLMEFEKRAALMEQNYKSEKNRIEKEYYVYVADHTIASISFEGNNVTYYSYRDWRYKELGGKEKNSIPIENQLVLPVDRCTTIPSTIKYCAAM